MRESEICSAQVLTVPHGIRIISFLRSAQVVERADGAQMAELVDALVSGTSG